MSELIENLQDSIFVDVALVAVSKVGDLYKNVGPD